MKSALGKNASRGKNNLGTKKRSVQQVSVPSAKGIKSLNDAPRQYASGKGYVIEHREYVADVVSAATNIFSVVRYGINPGYVTTFPWLANVATNYECYEVLAMDFELESGCATSTPGMWYMACDYDIQDSPPSTKQEMLSYSGAVKTNVWNHIKMDLTRVGTHIYKKRFVRTTPTEDQGQQLYDVGSLYLATVNNLPVNTFLGELYVSYKIKFTLPQKPNPSLSTAFNTGGALTVPTAPTNKNCLFDGVKTLAGLFTKSSNLFSNDTANSTSYYNPPVNGNYNLTLDAITQSNSPSPSPPYAPTSSTIGALEVFAPADQFDLNPIGASNWTLNGTQGLIQVPQYANFAYQFVRRVGGLTPRIGFRLLNTVGSVLAPSSTGGSLQSILRQVPAQLGSLGDFSTTMPHVIKFTRMENGCEFVVLRFGLMSDRLVQARVEDHLPQERPIQTGQSPYNFA